MRNFVQRAFFSVEQLLVLIYLPLHFPTVRGVGTVTAGTAMAAYHFFVQKQLNIFCIRKM